VKLFPPPDQEGPFSTGLWQLVYHVGGGRDLVFIGAGPEAEPCPSREWGIGVLRDKKRDRSSELRLQASPSLAGRLSACEIDGADLLVTQEGSIEVVVRAAKATFAQPEGSATPA
jgi:hypothetical protein